MISVIGFYNWLKTRRKTAIKTTPKKNRTTSCVARTAKSPAIWFGARPVHYAWKDQGKIMETGKNFKNRNVAGNLYLTRWRGIIQTQVTRPER